MRIKKSLGLKGIISVPGDKSISHRAIMLGALAEGETRVENFLMGEDCLATIDCFKKMGVKFEIIPQSGIPQQYIQYRGGRDSRFEIRVFGKGLNGLQGPKEPLYVGNSGTTIRILSGILAGQKFASEISGDASIQKRPMQRVVEPLRQMGAKIEGIRIRDKNEAYPPLKFSPSKLKGIEYSLPVASAQVKSCLLLAGLFAHGKTTVVEPGPSRDHTERMLEGMGIKVARYQGNKGNKGNKLIIEGGQKLRAAHIFVPGDISSAAFFMVAGLIVPNSEITIKNVGINPTRDGIIDVLHRMGANIEIKNEQLLSGELRADILVKSSCLPAGTAKFEIRHSIFEIRGEIIPRLIDEIPIIALAATQAEGTTIIKDAKELRVKESDRIKAVARELGKLGAKVEELEDGLKITGPNQLKGAVCESGGDHRIAMMCAIAGLVAEGETVVNDTRCIDTSFPGFEALLSSLKS